VWIRCRPGWGDRDDGGAGGGREVGPQIEVCGDEVVAVDEVVPAGHGGRDVWGLGQQSFVDDGAQPEW